jgi:hypothetical protein
MAQITIYLPEPDNRALEELARLEFRTPKEQAALIICAELERQGLLEPTDETQEDHQA